MLSGLLLVSTAGGALAQSRLALVVGNSNYPGADAPLKEPSKDARALADELKKPGVGFEVEMAENLSKEAMRKAFDRFSKIRSDSVALVFFSGFAIQSARQSYIIPVDGQVWTEADVRRDGVSLDSILREMNARGAKVTPPSTAAPSSARCDCSSAATRGSGSAASAVLRSSSRKPATSRYRFPPYSMAMTPAR